MRERGESYSDWRAAEAMSREEIERLADEDDGPLPKGWEDTSSAAATAPPPG